MKFCQPHWNDLRAAIDDRGLSPLIARDGTAAAKRLVNEIKGTATDLSWDPLMAAHWSIVNRAMSLGWAGPLDPTIECPLCFVQDHHDRCTQPNCEKPLPADWVASCTDFMLSYAREHKLIGEPS